jgi:bifunctional non-homologous end joining protein LigD
VKTSGKTGLHVVVPMAPTLRYDVVRAMAKMICTHLAGEHAEAITTQWDTGKRTGKVFMDFNMNVRGKSIIAPYGPRGLPGAPVSMPLTWRQLASADPLQFRLPKVGATARRSDPWSPLLGTTQSLEARLSALGAAGTARSR